MPDLPSEESKPFEVYFIESDHYWYVGCTTQTTAVRFAQHLVPSSDSPVGELAKQGVEFSWSVLEEGEGTHQDRIQAEQRWYEEKLYSGRGRTLNRQPPAGGKSFLEEGLEILLSTDFGKALARAAILEMAESHLRRSGYVRPPAMDGSDGRSCTSAQEVAEG